MFATVVIINVAVLLCLFGLILTISLLRIRRSTWACSLVFCKVRLMPSTVIPIRLVVSFRIGVPRVTCLVTLCCRWPLSPKLGRQ